MKFAFYTLGCKVNQYETQAMAQLLTARGHTVAGFETPCDGYIINTCSVTAVADKKNRNVIRRIRREHPEAVIAVCGCYPQHAAEEVRSLGVDLIGGSAKREDFIDQLLYHCEARGDTGCDNLYSPNTPSCHCEASAHTGCGNLYSPDTPSCHCEASAHTGCGNLYPLVDEALKRRDFEILPAGGLEGRTRAMLKVQDGCVNFCTYCIIPYTRGPVRSATVDTVVTQAKELAEKGYRELVITGIEIASWGVDLPGKPDLLTLLQAVSNAVPHLRLRLGSLEPRIITEEFCRGLQGLSNICPHFHLSMQSGSDTVLARMKRKYDTARYLQSVTWLNEYFPGCAITTDMIVAFPGETEEEFSESLAFIQKCAFAEMHIFPYSRRPGTPADKMPGQHPNAVKEARSKEAIAIAEEMSRRYRESLIGTEQTVLFEEPEGEYFTGHAPNYVKVYYQGEHLHNQEKSVRITALFRDGVLAE